MTIEEFVGGFLRRRYAFERPLEPESNELFMDFIKALKAIIPPETNVYNGNNWGKAKNDFDRYWKNGSSYKFMNNKGCTGNPVAPHDMILINYKDVITKTGQNDDLIALLHGLYA